jgi:uncharacterized phiE125 gp8 family phage protein
MNGFGGRTVRLGTSDMPVSFTMLNSSPDERVEPIDLDSAKKQMRFLSSSEDALIEGWIAAARAIFEQDTTRQIIDAIWEYGIDGTPVDRFIDVPRPPFGDIVGVYYTDPGGNEQTFDASHYDVIASSANTSPRVFDPYCGCGRIQLKIGSVWPVTNGLSRSLRVRRVCGYGATAADVPPLVKSALYLLVTHLHRNRAEVSEPATRGGLVVLPIGAKALMQTFQFTAMPQTPPRGWTCL